MEDSLLFINAVNLAKKIMVKRVKKGNIVVDATIGNGNDTLFLANLVGDCGKVYGFDIQDIAIDITKEKLLKCGVLERVQLINDSHENIDKYIKEKYVDLAIFNLGYLPGGDHSIITKPSSTIIAINKLINMLKKGSIILIIAYSGHEEGKKEKEEVEKVLKELDQKKYNVLKFDFINQINNPPVLFGVERKRD